MTSRRRPLSAAAGLLALVVLAGCNRWHDAGDSSSSGSTGPPAAPSAAHSDCHAPVTYQIFERNASGSDWSKPDNVIAFNRPESDGYYHIYTVRPNGSDLRQVGLGSATFPQRTTGSPAWSPSGAYLAFVAEKTGPLPGSLRGDTFGATPGWGGYSDLWISTANGSRAWRLTDLPVGNDDGVVLPQFSPNGKLLEWTQKLQGPGRTVDWSLKLAHFQVNAAGVPYLTDIQTIAPGGSAYPNEFVETGGFSANSQEMLFTSDYQNHLFFEEQIYKLNLSSGTITRLTVGGAYNEHPRFTPNGQIIWMTDQDQPRAYHGGTDWWIMNANGSDPHRLTDFNTPSGPDSFGQTVYATAVNTSNWGIGGSYFYGDLELNLITSESDILRVLLACRRN